MCKNLYPTAAARVKITDHQLKLPPLLVQDSRKTPTNFGRLTRGDSGAPLILEENKIPFLVGIASCASEHHCYWVPISMNIEWIKSVMKEHRVTHYSLSSEGLLTATRAPAGSGAGAGAGASAGAGAGSGAGAGAGAGASARAGAGSGAGSGASAGATYNDERIEPDSE